jgi:hypothetical protein
MTARLGAGLVVIGALVALAMTGTFGWDENAERQGRTSPEVAVKRA